MDSRSHPTHTADSPIARVLVVADWSVDAQAVIDACERRGTERPTAFALVVPAWLHGIDWVGDPLASVPCAQRQLAAITALATRSARRFATADVGDPEPVAAMCDALADWPADEVVICARGARVSHPFDLTHRAARVTGLPVERVDAPAPQDNGGARRAWWGSRNGHCVLDQPQAA